MLYFPQHGISLKESALPEEINKIGVLILKYIDLAKKAPPEEHRRPTMYSIICDISSSYCAQLKKDGVKSSEIVEKSRKLMHELEIEMKKLQEPPPKIKIQELSNDIELTEVGEKLLKRFTKEKSDPS